MSLGFDELGLSEATLQAIRGVGYEAPTTVQAESIPYLLAGRDVVVLSQTGTGKTAAFGLPLIEKVEPTTRQPVGLVLCPTRELATQVAGALEEFGRTSHVRIAALCGGQPIGRQIGQLRDGAQIVVGTPGRVLDHLRRDTFDASTVSYLVLDEADEMLAMGFAEDMEEILKALPTERQTAFFSATMPPPIARLAETYLRDPVRVDVTPRTGSTLEIRHRFYEMPYHLKFDALVRILELEHPGPSILFCRTKIAAQELGDRLAESGFRTDSLHGDMVQQDRDRVMQRFREGRVELLVATDVAARGLDIEGVTHVINFDIPGDAEVYTHRTGRTGRAGRTGDAITLIGPRERRLLQAISYRLGVKIELARVPSASAILERRRETFQESLIESGSQDGLEEFRTMVDALTETMDYETIAAAAIRLVWEQRGYGSISEDPAPRKFVANGPMTRLQIWSGRVHGLRPADLVGAIAGETGLPRQVVGGIEIHDEFTLFEVAEEAEELVITSLSRARLRGRPVKVERAAPDARPMVRRPRPEFSAPGKPRREFARQGGGGRGEFDARPRRSGYDR